MYSTLSGYLDFYKINRPNKVLMTDDERSVTFFELAQEVDELALGMQCKGLKKGDRVAMLAKNSTQYLSLFLACVKLGVVPVGLNYRLSAPEWNFIIEDAGAKLLFADAEYFSQLDGVANTLEQISVHGQQEGVCSFEEFKVAGELVVDNPPAYDDILFQMYTSGTTGHPKGVLLTQKNVLANAHQAMFTTGHHPISDDKNLIIAPLYHAAGLVTALCSVIYGAQMLIHRDYDPVRMITDIPKHKITAMTAIPVMLQFSLACFDNIREFDFSSLRCISYGASPISESLLKECIDIFECDFAQGYGQTEASGCLTMLTPLDHKRALAEEKPELLRSCGRAILGTEMAIFNEQGQPVPLGEVGEVVARGPQIMQGYWNREEANAKTLIDGWLYTGDAGYMDEEGYIYLCDRIKDMIISGGENIYPSELENVILAHERINDAAVIGVPDEKWGEVPLLVIAGDASDNPVTIDELNSYCRERIATYKIPKHIEYIAELPRNPSGKILKKDLRKLYADKYTV